MRCCRSLEYRRKRRARTRMRSFFSARFLDNGVGAKVQHCNFNVLDQISMHIPCSILDSFFFRANRALKTDRTPMRSQRSSQALPARVDRGRLGTIHFARSAVADIGTLAYTLFAVSLSRKWLKLTEFPWYVLRRILMVLPTR